MQLKRLLRYLIGVCAHYSGVDTLIRWCRGPSLTILMFHRLRDKYDPLPLSISHSLFDAITRVLRQRGLLRSLDDGLAHIRSDSRRTLYTLTFDDGYLDNLDLLRKDAAKFPSTIYLASGLIGGKLVWCYRLIDALERTSVAVLDLSDLHLGGWRLRTASERDALLNHLNTALKKLNAYDLENTVDAICERCRVNPTVNPDRMLNWDEVRQLQAAGIGIGAHTVNHTILTTIPLPQAEQEICDSRDQINASLPKPIKHFSYPNGQRQDFDREIKRLVQDAGFATAVTTVEGINTKTTDPFELKRFNVHEERFKNPWGRFSPGMFFCETGGLLALLHERIAR